MIINQKKAGVVLSYVGQFLKIIINIVYTPIMLRLLGQSEYGLYQLVYSVVSYLGLLSLGFGSSYLRFYSRYKVKNDVKEINRLNGIFMLIFLSISTICIICGIFMIENIHQIFGEGLTSNEYTLAKSLTALMIINLAITFPNSVFNCIITAHEEFCYQKLLIIVQNLLSPFLTLPLLLMGYGSIAMVLITTLITFGSFLSNTMFCFRKLHVHFSFRGLKFGLLMEMWVFTFFIFLNQIIDQINWSVDKFLLGRLLGTSAVAIYGVGSQINTMYMELSTSISNVFVPKVNRIVAETNDNRSLTLLFTKVGRIQFVVLMLVLTGFIFFGKEFITIWAGKDYLSAYNVVLLLIIPVTIPLIQNLGTEIQRAKNMHKTRSIVYLGISILNVFISIPLIKLFGPSGAAFGTSISLFLGNVLFMNWYYEYRIGLNMKLFWKEIFSFAPAFILPTIFGFITMKYIEIKGLFILIVFIIIYSILYLVSMYLFGMNADEKYLFKQMVIRYLPFV